MIVAAPDIALPGIAHGFFTREGGVSRGLYAGLNCGPGSADKPHDVAENRARVARSLKVEPDQLVTLHQVHSPMAVTVDAPIAHEARPRADGMATATPGLALGILTADCAPVLFADPEAGVIGAAHAGWRGALAGILEATLSQMERLGADRGRIIAAIGPTISQAHYEVGREVRDQVLSTAVGTADLFVPSDREGHYRFDLPGYVAARLAQAGAGRIAETRLCTYADEVRFFSFRRSTHRGEADYGRQISVICLDV